MPLSFKAGLALTAVSLALVLHGGGPAPAGAGVASRPQTGTPAMAPLLKALLEAEAFALPAADLLRASAAVPPHPRYSVLALMESNRLSYDEGGRGTGTLRYVFRVDRDAAIQGWGTVQAGWLPWLEQRPVIRARVITPDGQEHVLDPATLGDAQTPEDSPEMFQDRRLLRGPLPKLQVGAVVEVEIRTQDLRPFSSCGVRRTVPLFSNVPVQGSRLVIELPASAPLVWSLDALPRETLQRAVKGNRLTLRVEQGPTLPPKGREPYQAWDQDPWPALTFATTRSWAAVVAEYRGIVEGRLQGADLKAWVQAAVGDAKERTQVIDRILTRLHQQVRYIGLEFGEAAIVPRTPAETLRRGYGDCKDKSTLLVALLREAGIEAHLALLRAGNGRDFSPEYPGLAAFNHAIVRVGGPDPIWIDPAVPQAPAGLLPLPNCGRRALVITEGTLAPILIPDVDINRNLQIETREVFLAEDGKGRVVETTAGLGTAEIALRAQFTGADPVRLKENLKKYVKETYKSDFLERSELTDPLDLHQPFRLTVAAKQMDTTYTSQQDARVVMNPWSLVKSLNESLQPGEKDPAEEPETPAGQANSSGRRTDLQLPHGWAAEMRWRIHAPKGYGSETLPAASQLKFGPAELTLSWKALADGEVEAGFRFSCAQRRWTPQEVETARAALKRFAEESSPVLVFQQKGEAHLRAGRLPEALAEFRTLVAADPTAAAPLIRLARAQLQAGLGESARVSLGKAITLEPGSEHAHRQLGWTLEHDGLGRRFSPGWDRAGALSALRKAMELAPELRAARLDLAILLGVDAQGANVAGKDLEASMQLYRDQLARGKDAKAQENLTEALARMGRLEEARAAATAMEAAPARSGWIVALDACSMGSPAAIQEARRTHQDPEVCRQAFQDGSDLLMNLRRYPEAGALAREGAGSAGEAAKLPARALLCPRLKRYETVTIDRKTPTGAVLAFAKATLSQDLAPERFFELLSPAQRPDRTDAAAARAAMKTFHYLSPRNSDWRDRRFDEAFSVGVYSQEGSEATGCQIRCQPSSPFPNDIYVSCHEGVWRVVGWGPQPTGRLGREALWELGRGNLAGACAWLDRALELAVKPTPLDPLWGHVVTRFWTLGRKGTREEIRLAAALLVLATEPDEPSRKTVEAALASTREPDARVALLRCLMTHATQGEALKRADALSAEILGLYPAEPRAALFRSYFLQNANRLEEAIALVAAARAARPDFEELAAREATLLASAGRLEAGAELLKGRVLRGKTLSGELNSLAWADLCRGKVTEQTAEWIEQDLQRRRGPNNLHTQAGVLAELGRFGAAREAILGAFSGDESPRAVDWYVFGRIAEGLGEPTAARACYARVDGPPSNPENPKDPTTCRYLARRRLDHLAGSEPTTR